MASMPLSRKVLHTRHVTCVGYARSDGLIDIEAELRDISPDGTDLVFKVVPPQGEIHHMRVVLTMDRDLVIRDASVQFLAAPTGFCAEIEPAYRALIGLQIRGGFRQEAKNLFGGAKGCTHLTELLGPMATTAMQTRMAQSRLTRDTLRTLAGSDPMPRPGFVNSCHTYRIDGEAIKVMWPEHRRIDNKEKQKA